MTLPKLRFSFSLAGHTEVALSPLAQLGVEVGQCENFDHLADCLKSGLEDAGLQGCFLMSCFGFNRETRFGRWKSRYVFPLRADLSEIKPTATVRDDLIIVSSGYFTLVVGRAAHWLTEDPLIVDRLLMLSETSRIWVKAYTAQVDQQFDALNHRKAGCQQLLEVVHQLDQSGKDISSSHHRMLTAINAGVPQGIAELGLSEHELAVVLDELDEIGRAYTIFTKQQMELNRQLKEQVRSVAGFLLPRGSH
ncbi:MAG TPA: hypothetical protein VIC26_17045 [Marinagarivorans sp.]